MTTRLALHGGAPVRSTLLPYGRQSIEERDIAAVAEVLRSDWLTTGPKVAEFEGAVARFVGAGHAVAVNSGTAALHVALAALEVGPGDEVLVPPLTFCATANVVLHLGARPVFVDVEPSSLGIDPREAVRRMRPQTRAVVGVDFAGHPCDVEALAAAAREREVAIVQDAAHALGASVGSERVGAIADLTTFSFHPVKHVACGEGGMVTTHDDVLAERMRRMRNHGLTSEARDRREGARWAYDMPEPGFNFRMPDVLCALGLSQLERIGANLARRRELAARYRDAISEPLGLVPVEPRAGTESAWHLFAVRIQPEVLRAGRDELLAALRAEGIGANVHYRLVSELSHYRQLGYDPRETPVAHEASQRLLSLPMFHSMTDRDFDDVMTAVHKVFEHYRR